MQLREIHIDGFGVFFNKQITGLSSGINVLYGPNEFGKSTLLAFIRRILFGFRVPSSANPYPAMSGGAYGGRIVCQLANGETVTISRKTGPLGGPVEISTGDGTFSGQEELNRIVNLVHEKVYKNVYAIGLYELEAIKTLEEDEIRNVIYGVGLELGNMSLTEIQKSFQKQADEVFKPGGSVQIIPRLYKDIRAKEKTISDGRIQLSEYDNLVGKQNELQIQIKSLGTDINELLKNKSQLQVQKNLFSTYVELKKAEEELTLISETVKFDGNDINKLETLSNKVTDLTEKKKEAEEELIRLNSLRDELSFDERILTLEADIVSLQKKNDSFKSASEDIPGVNRQIIERNNEIKRKVQKIGLGWDEESIRNFNLTHIQEDEINIAKEQIQEANSSIENINTKRQIHLDTIALENSKGINISPLLRYTGYLSIAGGAIGVIWGYISTVPSLSILSFCLLAAGLILSFTGRKSNKSIEPTPLEKRYQEELSVAERKLSEVADKWQNKISNMGFKENISPDAMLSMVRTISEIQSELKLLDDLSARSTAMQSTLDGVNNLVSKIVKLLDKPGFITDTLASIEIITTELNKAKSIKSQKDSIDRQINARKEIIPRIQNNIEEANKELQEYISNHGALDIDDFRQKYKAFQERENLKGIIERNKKTIQSFAGIRELYTKFMESISITDLATISAKLQEQDAAIEDMRNERDAKQNEVGKLQLQIDGLSAGDLSENQIELEVKKQQLQDYSTDWVKAQIALFAIDKAISKYENTRQPEVIKAATNIFDNITGHTYPKIIKTTGTDELVIQDNSARRKTIKEMSRGTKEQLYFAMRLGLISLHDSQSEPLPIIMDDILVNFDDGRGPAAIKGLIEFSSNRQVIVLTCHKNTLDTYIKFGARKISFV